MNKAMPYLFALLVAFPVLWSPTPASAQATTNTTNLFIPLDVRVFVPCANGGTGESVQLSGDLHIVFHTTISDSGRLELNVLFQAHASGVGLTTGDQYQATEEQHITRVYWVSVDEFPVETTMTHNLRFIGQGPGNNFELHEIFHVTVNANGEVTASVTNTSVDCM